MSEDCGFTLKIKLLRENAAAPRRATGGSAGYDLTAAISKPMDVYPERTTIIPTGIAAELPQGYVGLIFARSGLASKSGVAPINAVGVIDSDYRGEICVPLTCHHIDWRRIEPGERIAQLVIVRAYAPETEIVAELGESGRGEGGFGSTGR